jgi:hypothetical protein
MKRRHFAARVVALALALSGALFVGCGEDAAIVGGTCVSPYVACGHECVDLATDARHCGGCDVACGAGQACTGGRCGGADETSEGGSADATLDRSASDAIADRTDAPVSVEASADGGDDARADDGAVDGAGPDSSSADGASTDACAPPYVTDQHCGDCFTRCQGTDDSCKATDAGVYACAPFCAPPLSRCGDTCKDLTIDGDNCGVCSRVCASNICINSVCQGAASGDIVYIGHDYFATPPKTSQARLLENAVLLSPTTPVRVLAYQKYASANAVTKAIAILADAQTRSGRAIQITGTSTDAAIAGITKAAYDVVLFYDQVSAPAGTMATLGAGWKSALGAFTHAGGVFVVLDGAAGPTAEMPEFSNATGLLAVAGHQSVAAGEELEIIAPTDALSSGVVSPFAMRLSTARFLPEANGGPVSWVVRHVATGQAAVVHKIAP